MLFLIISTNFLTFLVKDYRAYAHGVKKLKGSKCTRSELLEQISALNIAVTEGCPEYMHALVVGIKYSVGKDKELLHRLVDIEDIVLELLNETGENQ